MKEELNKFYEFLVDEKLIENTENQFDVIKKFIKLHTRRLSGSDAIVQAVARKCYLNVDDLMIKTRKREVVECRQIAMWMMKRYTKLSLAAIGAYFTKPDGTVFDHATVLHACKTVNNLRETDKTFRVKFEDVKLAVEKIK